jgi:hypothetical protein
MTQTTQNNQSLETISQESYNLIKSNSLDDTTENTFKEYSKNGATGGAYLGMAIGVGISLATMAYGLGGQVINDTYDLINTIMCKPETRLIDMNLEQAFTYIGGGLCSMPFLGVAGAVAGIATGAVTGATYWVGEKIAKTGKKCYDALNEVTYSKGLRTEQHCLKMFD